MSELLTLSEAAELTGIPVTTIRWHCRNPRGLLYGLAKEVPLGKGRHYYMITKTQARLLKRTWQTRKEGGKIS